MEKAVKKLKGRKAPGPDGIPQKALALAMGELAPVVSGLLTDCLRTG